MNEMKENCFCDLGEREVLAVNGGTAALIPYGGALIGGCAVGFAIGYAIA